MRLLQLAMLCAVIGACTFGCDSRSAATAPSDYSTVLIDADRDVFMGGVITPTPSSGQFLVIVELSPAHHPDSRKLCDLCRAGHPVSVHLRQDASNAPRITVTNITSQGEAIIRCKSQDEAKGVIDQLHAWPSH
jgi:hypothetical protein